MGRSIPRLPLVDDLQAVRQLPTGCRAGSHRLAASQSLDELIRVIEENISTFDNHNLCSAILSLSRHQLDRNSPARQEQLQGRLLEKARQRSHSLSGQELAGILRCVARQQGVDDSIYALGRRAACIAAELTSGDLATVLDVLSKLLTSRLADLKEVFEVLAQEVIRQAERLDPQDLAMVLHAYSKLPRNELGRHEGVFAALAPIIALRAGELECKGLALALSAYSKLPMEQLARHEQVFSALAPHVATRAGELKPQELAMVLSAYSKLPMDQIAKHEQVFRALAPHAACKGDQFKAQELSMVLNAYSKLPS